MAPTPATPPHSTPASDRTCSVLVYAVPNTDLRVIVDGIHGADDLVQAQAIAQGVLRELAATPAAQRRTRVLCIDDITDIPATPSTPTIATAP